MYIVLKYVEQYYTLFKDTSIYGGSINMRMINIKIRRVVTLRK